MRWSKSDSTAWITSTSLSTAFDLGGTDHIEICAFGKAVVTHAYFLLEGPSKISWGRGQSKEFLLATSSTVALLQCMVPVCNDTNDDELWASEVCLILSDSCLFWARQYSCNHACTIEVLQSRTGPLATCSDTHVD